MSQPTHGGYRRPSNPAPVSGPGANSRRTDGQPIRDLPNADYGENATFTSLQQQAPLAGAGGAATGGGGAVTDMLAGLTGLDQPSAEPDVPVTAGAEYGAGPGPEALGIPRSPAELRSADAAELSRYINAMVAAASNAEATPSFKRYVRLLIANMRK